MAQPVTQVRVYPTLESMSRGVAMNLQDLVAKHTTGEQKFSVCLSGGTTPTALYQLLAAEFAEKIPWSSLQFFWGDERYVPDNDRANNAHVAREVLFNKVTVSSENIFPMPTNHENPDDAAHEYEALLRRAFHADWPRFDLVLLGMGEDGHTASLFPGSQFADEDSRWVVRTDAPTEPTTRLSLTLPVFNSAAHVYMLVAGDAKAEAVHQTLSGPPEDMRLPAACIQQRQGRLVWWLDEAAAARLDGVSGINIQRFSD